MKINQNIRKLTKIYEAFRNDPQSLSLYQLELLGDAIDYINQLYEQGFGGGLVDVFTRKESITYEFINKEGVVNAFRIMWIRYLLKDSIHRRSS